MLLLASTTDTGAGTYTSTGFHMHPQTVMCEFFLNVTTAASGATDTGNFYIQTSTDGGVNWDDLVSFTQLLGNGGTKQFYARWSSVVAPTTPTGAKQDGSLAAGTVVQGPKALFWRTKRVLVNVTAVSFTYTVTAYAKRWS